MMKMIMRVNHCLIIVVMLSSILSSKSLYAKDIMVVDSAHLEKKILLKEGMFLAINKEEFKQFAQFIIETRNYVRFVSVMTACAVAAVSLGFLFIELDLRAIQKAIKC